MERLEVIGSEEEEAPSGEPGEDREEEPREDGEEDDGVRVERERAGG